MNWARFEIISGMLDVLLILLGVTLMVQFRVIKKSLARRRVRETGTGGGEGEDRADPTFSSVLAGTAVRDLKAETDWIGERDRERRRFEQAVREVERLRSELEILFFDVQRSLDDLAQAGNAPEESQSRTVRSVPVPAEETVRDRVFRMSREGRSVAEISADVGRGEGEVAFLLAMEKVGSSG